MGRPKNQEPPSTASKALIRFRLARDSVLRSIHNLNNLAEQVKSNTEDIQKLLVRIDSLDKYVDQFNVYQQEILSNLVDLDLINEYETIDLLVSDEMELLCGNIRLVAKSSNVNQSVSEELCDPKNGRGTRAVQTVMLPKIELPKFDGNVVGWCSFRDMFSSLVRDNPSITNIERFHYLVSCLSGSALAVVKAVPLTADNYTIAWDALVDCFENQRLLATAHIDKLFAFSPIKRESCSSLSLFVNTFRENVSAIKALGIEDISGFLLFYIGARVLDPETRRLFEANLTQSEIPTLDKLLDFTSQRCRILENIGTNNDRQEVGKKEKVKMAKGGVYGKASFTATTSSKSLKCILCQHEHLLYRCFLFKRKSVSARRKFVNDHSLCFTCLKPGHLSNSCPTTYKCRTCEGKHNTLLHKDSVESGSNVIEELRRPESPINGEIATGSAQKFSGTTHTDATVVLGTAMVRVRDMTGQLQPVRILLDCGSQVSAITSQCATRLGLKRYRSQVEVVGLSQQPIAKVKGITHCTFVPFQSEEPHFNVSNIIVLSQITRSIPGDKLPESVRDRYRHLVLADPNFDVPCAIDMLIGNDLYPLLLPPRADIIHNAGLPSAMNTLLGWVVVGALRELSSSPLVSLTLGTVSSMDGLLQKFWEVEEPSTDKTSTTEENQCEDWFQRTVTRDTQGRFCVALPFRTKICPESEQSEIVSQGLGSSRQMALSRLYGLERKLIKDPALYTSYRKFMDDYISLGHMKPAPCQGNYFIPHHAVVKGDKLRVVFDASAKSTSGSSLNDCLVTGPKLQTEISEVLLRNRFRKYVFVADIEKMYRQIKVREEDCSYQHILWRRFQDEEVREYQLCTVTYGVNAAPYLAIRCLRQLDEVDGPLYPRAQGILITQTYVDDIIAGADSIEEVLALQQDVISLLHRGSFVLKKWASNCAELLEKVPAEHRALDPFFRPQDEQAMKILGLQWDVTSDTFGYHVNIEEVTPTKRSVLSTIARLYDPVGVLGPVVFWAKCLLQELWLDKSSWDSPISSVLALKWHQFMTELSSLSDVSIPRHIDVRCIADIQLLGFADASQRGYAASVFLRVLDNVGNVRVHFITCKTKVAPLKSSNLDTSLTIPRLELCAALLLSQLLSQRRMIIQSIINITCVRAWTDSSIVLSWITKEQKNFKIFVTNRVAKINSLVPDCEWAHVRSINNPADPASRGMFPKELLSCPLHLTGPDFLQHSDNQWPNAKSSEADLPTLDQLPEIRNVTQCVHMVLEDYGPEDIFRRFSSLSKLQRVLAQCFRFIARARKQPVIHGPVTPRELDYVLFTCIRITQHVYWPQLPRQLSNKQAIITPKSLAQLSPFLDPHDVIRVGGRLKFSSLHNEAKHPALLPKKTYLTRLIILHYHLSLLHGGMRLVMSLIQRRFWIVSGRAAIRAVLHSCVVCTRFRASCPQPCMADLPPNRVKQSHPFSSVGTDYGGPFVVKESRRRNARTHKAYLALFICMSTKAVHLEVVWDLSTDSFLAAFDRFVSRRGIPTEVYSDCGTNYIGAAREFKTLFNEANTRNTIQVRAQCLWKFNPPAAPHFGGIWEAAIKSVKTHLKRVIGVQILTMEELTTLIIKIEGILNSRPLMATSNDPNDLDVLSPGHFLIGRPIMSMPERDLENIPLNRLDRWQLIKQAQQSFWKRWSHEYLQTLQGRQKWNSSKPNLNIGDLVVINSPGRSPMSWQLGRVMLTHPGPDNIVRVVTLKTSEGTLKRPVVKVVKLPVEADLS